LNNMIFLLCNRLFKINLDNYEIIEKNECNDFQGLDTQNKTNLLYVSSSEGYINVFNIKTLNLLKRIQINCCYDVNNKIDGDIFNIKIIRDTMYMYLYEPWDTGIDKILIINDLNDVNDKKELQYECYDLQEWHFSTHTHIYKDLLYFSGESGGGIHIFNVKTKQVIKMIPSLCCYKTSYKNFMNIQNKYLIHCVNVEPYKVEIFDLENNPLLENIDFYFEFETTRVINVEIKENIIYFYKIKLDYDNGTSKIINNNIYISQFEM